MSEREEDLSSLEELQPQLAQMDVEVRARVSIEVEVRIYHPDVYSEMRSPMPFLSGYIVELFVPAHPQEGIEFWPEASSLDGGDQQLMATLEYPSVSEIPLSWEHVLQALRLDPKAKVWHVRSIVEEK